MHTWPGNEQIPIWCYNEYAELIFSVWRFLPFCLIKACNANKFFVFDINIDIQQPPMFLIKPQTFAFGITDAFKLSSVDFVLDSIKFLFSPFQFGFWILPMFNFFVCIL